MVAVVTILGKNVRNIDQGGNQKVNKNNIYNRNPYIYSFLRALSSLICMEILTLFNMNIFNT